MKRPAQDATPDLFATAADARGTEQAAFAIQSPAIDEARALLEKRAMTLGNLLASDRAVEYVAVLRAFAAFRDRHEPEPLHEDIARAVCGEDPSPFAETAFKSDLRQLKDWGLVSERIEKERLRGYRDNKRTKFRYHMCDDAVSFVAWLDDRRAHDLDPSAGDVTGNLLDLQCSLMHELRRRMRALRAEETDYDQAGDILYRIEQMNAYVDATAKTLQELNLRLLSFGAENFSTDEARGVVDELALFLERFGRRFGTLREEILRDISDLRREAYAKRWEACTACLKTEAAKFRHIASIRIPDAVLALSEAALFYGTDGTLVNLMSRVGDSARKVWGKLNAKLRELERRNHRLEDLQARLLEFAQLPEDRVPYGWMRRLLETAAMRGDAQIRPGSEKSVAPLPKAASKVKAKKAVTWITPRTVGGKADVASIAQVRAERLREWMAACGIMPAPGSKVTLGGGRFRAFGDFPNIVQLIEKTRLGNGEKGRKFLSVSAEPTGETADVTLGEQTLSFDDLALTSAGTVPVASK